MKAGRTAEVVSLLTGALTDAPGPPGAYRVLGALLHQARRPEAEIWARRGVEAHPENADIWNLLGVVLKQRTRLEEAANALEQARRLAPENVAVLHNLANIYTMTRHNRAEEVCRALLATDGGNGEYHRLMGLATREPEQALGCFRRAIELSDSLSAWLDVLGLLSSMQRHEEALQAVQGAIPRHPGLAEAEAVILRESGRDPVPYLQRHLGKGWAHRELATAEPANAVMHLRAALAADPSDQRIRLKLIDVLRRQWSEEEGSSLDEAYGLAKAAASHGDLNADGIYVVRHVLWLVGDYDAANRLGATQVLGNAWAAQGQHGHLLSLMPTVNSMEDRQQLLRQHQLWGETVEKLVEDRA